MTLKRWFALAVAVALLFTAAPGHLWGQEEDEKTESAALDIGAKAPALEVGDWVKGKKVEEFAKGQIYVVEFWATWCGPCKATMPHLAELQTKYGDKVKMIGVSDEETSEVEDFLKKDQSKDKTWDEVVTYALVMDDERKTNEAYMVAAGERGIPTAFIIGKEGQIEWIGHPMGMDEPLQSIVDGKWDRAVAKAERAEAKETELAMAKVNRAMARGDSELALELIDEILAKKPDLINLAVMKLQILESEEKEKEAKEYAAKLLPQIDEQIAKNPKFMSMAFVKLQILNKGEDKSAGEKYAEEVLKLVWDDAQMLNQLSWYIAAEKMFPGTLDTALKAAKRGVELTKEKDAMILDTLARVYFEQGNLVEAIEWQKKAVEQSEDPSMKETLEKYEEAKKEVEKKAA